MRWFVTTFLVAGFCTFCWAAEAQFPQFPKPRPAAAPQITQAEIQAPAVQAPPQVAAPAVVVAAPSTLDEIKSWLVTTFWGIIAAAFGKIAIAGVKTTAPSAPGEVSPEASILLKLRDKATDPELRSKIDATLLNVWSTGVPSKIVQTGLGAVPVAGPLLSGIEPMLQQAFVGFLKSRLDVGAKP